MSAGQWARDWDLCSRDSRARECRRLLTEEATGTTRPCGGAVHTAYIRRGSAGAWTRVGLICRHCGHYTPDPPPELVRQGHTLREATDEEAERWRRTPPPHRPLDVVVRDELGRRTHVVFVDGLELDDGDGDGQAPELER